MRFHIPLELDWDIVEQCLNRDGLPKVENELDTEICISLEPRVALCIVDITKMNVRSET